MTTKMLNFFSVKVKLTRFTFVKNLTRNRFEIPIKLKTPQKLKIANKQSIH